jgi:acyl-CoA synthetase (AMP-forming)/AMP-acid ligase II
MNVGLLSTRSARRAPDSLACFDDDRTLTYRELNARACRLANALRVRYGLEDHDRVALLVPNRLEVTEVLAAAAKARLTYVGLNFRMSQSELNHVFDNAEPRILLTDTEHAELAHAVVDGRDIPVVDVETQGYADLLADSSDDEPPQLHQVRPDDDFCIVYTSGTTGTPKGVWFDHGRVMQHAAVACLEYEIAQDSRYLVAIPHNSSMNITFVPGLMRGAAIGFSESRGFDPERFVREVATHAASHSYLVPTQLYRVLDRVRAPDALRSMVTLGYGAAPMAPDKVAALIERFGPIFNQLYGMAEIASIGTMLRKEDHVRALQGAPQLFGSAGQSSYLVDVRVVDLDGNDVRVGERGEVIFGTPYAMKGYYRDPERTAETLRSGWVHSGDVAEVDEDGFIYIVDRMKDLIIRGGYNISPTEVEAVMHRHPDVLEVGVIGVPDPEWGESVLAVVALRPGSEATDRDLLAWCAQDASLASVKRPERVEFIDELPKNAVGKIAKNELRNRFWSGARRV